MKKLILTFLILIIVVVLGLLGYFYWNKTKKVDTDIKILDTTDNITQEVLPEINTNPLKNNPEINPVDKTNPFKDIKTNPFE